MERMVIILDLLYPMNMKWFMIEFTFKTNKNSLWEIHNLDHFQGQAKIRKKTTYSVVLNFYLYSLNGFRYKYTLKNSLILK